MRLIDADVLKEDLTRFYDGEVTARQLIDAQPTVQPAPPEPCEDAVSRRAAIDAMGKAKWAKERLMELPSAQPDHIADTGRKVEQTGEIAQSVQDEDLISRQAAIDALDKRFDDVPMELTTEILQLRRDLRERIPSAQPAASCSEIPNGSDDTISRQAAIETLARMMPRSYTPDGSHPGDEEIFRAQEVIADCIEALEILPSAQPEIIRCKDCDWWTKQEDSVQGRCELMQMYPAGEWYCGNARRMLE